MCTQCSIKLINNHIIIEENGQNILVDTGSPLSFHPSGNLVFGEEFPVSPTYLGVTPQYLSENVGYEIHGLLGMDIINRMPVTFNLEEGFMLFDDGAEYPHAFEMYPIGPSAMGLVAIKISVNNRRAKMIVDTGAPISYIALGFVEGLESVGMMDDFHPSIGNFQTETYNCDVYTLIGDEPYSQIFGIPTQELSITFGMLNVDGIIGVELFKRYRLQIKDQSVFLLP